MSHDQKQISNEFQHVHEIKSQKKYWLIHLSAFFVLLFGKWKYKKNSSQQKSERVKAFIKSCKCAVHVILFCTYGFGRLNEETIVEYFPFV